MATALVVADPEGGERAAVVSEEWVEPQGGLASQGRDPGHFVRGMERWRKELGLSMNAFADHLGVSRSYYSLVRRGLRPVTMALVNRVLQERPELAYTLPIDATALQS